MGASVPLRFLAPDMDPIRDLRCFKPQAAPAAGKPSIQMLSEKQMLLPFGARHGQATV